MLAFAMVAEASKSPVYDVRTFRSGEAVGALVGLARKALAEEFERELEPLGLNVVQALVILFLADGRASTSAQMCRMLSHDAGAMTRIVDRLEERGFVRRVRAEHDRRAAHLELTKGGKALHGELTRVQVEVLNKLLRGFTKSEARTLEALLKRILENANGRDE
jgi:DNA-binding MarR family transcriptional regulator